MRTVAVIQARMGSTRLPGKILREVAGKPLLAHQIDRMRRCRLLDEIVVATTGSDEDQAVVRFAESQALRWFCGSEEDVLSRYAGAAAEAHADAIVRITADCPLIDPEQIDRVAGELAANAHDCDYVSNVMERTFPRGLDTEAMPYDVILRLDRMAQSQPAREHVTHFIHHERPELFVCRSVKDEQNNSDLRWTVDTLEDFEMIRQMYERFDLGERFIPYHELLRLVRSMPDLLAMNATVAQKVI